MKKITFILGLCLSVVLAVSAHAKPYSVAGCGLGSVLFKGGEQTQATQVMAATTNGTFYTQTFGISSGTSNCTDDGAVHSSLQVPLFIENNRTALATDAARGRGETIEHLAALMGCSDSGLLGAELQRNYGTIFSTDNIKAENVTQPLLQTVKTSSLGCTRVI